MTADTRPITDRLKQDTQDLHDAAEEGGYNKALISGKLARDRYVAMLGQFLHVHRALEGLIREHAGRVPALDAVMTDEQYQEAYLLEDLRHFGVDPEAVEAIPSTRALIEQITKAAEENPISLVGFHYVLEGSNNGGRVIAMSVRDAYGLEGREGTRYLDPYGTAQRGMWREWKANLGACELSEAEMGAMVSAARQMFAGIAAIHDELYEACAPAGG